MNGMRSAPYVINAILNNVFAGKAPSSLIVCVRGEYPGDNNAAIVRRDRKNIGAIIPSKASTDTQRNIKCI